MCIPKQVKILNEKVKMFKYIFLRGSGGVGKTYTLGKFIESNNLRHDHYIFLGPTGKSVAVAEDKGLRGSILHRYFEIQTNDNFQDIDEYIISKHGNIKKYNQKMKKRLIGIKYIFIDEISMINNELLEHMLVTIQASAEKNAVVVLSGDYHQLPPIIDKTLDEYKNVGSSLDVIVALIKAKAMTVIDFITRYRSEDENYNEFLHDIRMGAIQDSTSIANYLQHYFNVYSDRKGIPKEIEKKLTFLEFVNAKVKYINDTMLEELPGQEHRINCDLTELKYPEGKAYMADDIMNNFQMDSELVFKIGSKIVFRTNNNELGYKNGDEGLITSFDGMTIGIDRFQGSDVIKMRIPKHEYTSTPKQQKRGYNITIKQYPISLIHSKTLHKSQGDEYQFMHIDFSFLENNIITNTMKWLLLYVALSRVSFPKGVWVHKRSLDILKKQFRLFKSVKHNKLAVNLSGKVIPYIRREDIEQN